MGSPLVLVVDDEPDIRQVLTIILEDEGFAVRTAANGREAWDLLVQQRPAVLLLDLNMPVMSGWELHERLRTEQLRPAVIFMTAGQHACTEAVRHGADDCLPKPFDLDDVLQVITRYTTDSAR